MSYEIIDISDVDIDQHEQLGTKSKFWYEHNGNTYLFKSTKTSDKYGNVIIRHGEDWAEKIACEIAEALKIPHVHYELALYRGDLGVISRNFIVGNGDRLSTGNELIDRVNTSTPIESDQFQRIARVFLVMEKIIKKKPLGFDALTSIKDASDFFVGYLLLDALISNQDRHVENWGMIETFKGTTHLAPSFDHAASLGRNESDENRQRRLVTRDRGQSVEHYVSKAKSHFYDSDNNRLKVLQAFEHSAIINPLAADSWLLILEGLGDNMIENIIEQVPSERMTDLAKEFSFKLIICNKRNLLDLLGKFK